MTGLVRKATLLSAGAMILVAATAMAGTPFPANCTVPCNIKLVGVDVGANEPGGLSILATVTGPVNRVVVRDVNNNIVIGQDVTVDFTACATGPVRLATTQLQDGLITSSCGLYTLSSDGSGVCDFRIIGGADNVSGPVSAGENTACVDIRAGSTDLTPSNVTVAMFDHDYVAGVDPTDLGRFFLDSLAPGNKERSNYDCAVPVPIDPTDLFFFFMATLGADQSTGSGDTDCF
jgi:hypothetical protein